MYLPTLVAAFALAATPQPSPSPTPLATSTPGLDTSEAIAVELCSAEQQTANNPNLRVGIGFRNLRDVAAVHVVFDVMNVDPQGTVVAYHTVSIDGTFAPNELIQPRRAAWTGTLLTQPEYPDSPAWNVPNHFGSGATQVRCVADSATFKDGSTWKRASLDQ